MSGDQSVLHRVTGQAGDIVHADSFHQLSTMEFDGFRADLEIAGDFLGGFAGSDKAQDFCLANGQYGAADMVAVRQGVIQCFLNARRQEAAVLGDRLNRKLQLREEEVFQQVAVGAGRHGLFDDFVTVDAGQDEDSGGGVELTDGFGDLDTRRAGHGDVENRDVGLLAPNFGDRLVAVGAFGNDFVPGQRFEQSANPGTNQQLVVSENDPERFHAGWSMSNGLNCSGWSC